MQAVCDARRRFLWVDLKYPGSTSDFFAFDQSTLKSQLEQQGFLRRGLCLFGDAAYANSPYMVTPFRSATGTKDDFNFFQSQLRINIECAFGMLVHRFGMLRKAFPMGVSLATGGYQRERAMWASESPVGSGTDVIGKLDRGRFGG